MPLYYSLRLSQEDWEEVVLAVAAQQVTLTEHGERQRATRLDTILEQLSIIAPSREEDD